MFQFLICQDVKQIYGLPLVVAHEDVQNQLACVGFGSMNQKFEKPVLSDPRTRRQSLAGEAASAGSVTLLTSLWCPGASPR